MNRLFHRLLVLLRLRHLAADDDLDGCDLHPFLHDPRVHWTRNHEIEALLIARRKEASDGS